MKNVIAIFEISTLEFVKMQSFTQSKKTLNLVPNLPCLGSFGVNILKTLVIFEISALDFVELQSFIQKNFKLGTINALFK